MKKLKLSTHAKDRMKRRNIKTLQVKKVVEKPMKTINQANGRMKAVSKLDNGRVLEVIYKETRNNLIIITTHYGRKIR